MLSTLKTSLEKLEQAATKAEAELHKIKAQHEAAVARVKELGNEVAEAFADSAPNAEDLQEAHFKAELRAGSLAKAVVTANNRHGAAKGTLAEAKAKAKAEAAAETLRQLAKQLEEARPAAAKAARQVAAVAGGVPANIPWQPMIQQAFDHWISGAVGFFKGDFITLAVKELRLHADEILKRNRSADLGQSFDAQAISYGRQPIGGLKKAG
jgi:hypothetical protein